VEFTAGDVGLAVCAAMSLTNWLNYGMVVSAEVENYMVSYKRSIEYTKLPREENGKDNKLLSVQTESWPSAGSITFDKVNFKHIKDGQNVLQNISFNIRPSEKIGIVGRTGAGKSSILAALYRTGVIVSGKVGIDDVNDHSLLPVNLLRSKMTIIPQVPVLFKNTLRFNLDPTENVPDYELISALSQVGFRQRDLDYIVEDNGGNLSVGEKQLLSVARTLVRNSKIVAMDEATANIDPR